MIIHEIESLISEADGRTAAADAWHAIRQSAEDMAANAINTLNSQGKALPTTLPASMLNSFEKVKEKFDMQNFANWAKSKVTTTYNTASSKTGGGNLDTSEKSIGGGHGANLDDNYIGQSDKVVPNGYDPASNLDDLPDGVDPLNFATKSRADSYEMFKDVKQTFQLTGNFLDRLTKKSEDIADVIADYFVPFQKNPIVRDLVELSNENPHLFNAMIVAVPAVLIGAVGGTYAYIKKIRTVKDAQAELDKATTELNNASSDSAKAAASKKVALIGAKAIVLAKASK